MLAQLPQLELTQRRCRRRRRRRHRRPLLDDEADKRFLRLLGVHGFFEGSCRYPGRFRALAQGRDLHLLQLCTQERLRCVRRRRVLLLLLEVLRENQIDKPLPRPVLGIQDFIHALAVTAQSSRQLPECGDWHRLQVFYLPIDFKAFHQVRKRLPGRAARAAPEETAALLLLRRRRHVLGQQQDAVSRAVGRESPWG